MKRKNVLGFVCACCVSLGLAGCAPKSYKTAATTGIDAPSGGWSMSQRLGYVAGYNSGVALAPNRAWIDSATVRLGLLDADDARVSRYPVDQQQAAKRQVAAQQQAATPLAADQRAELRQQFSYAVGVSISRYSAHAGDRLDHLFLADGFSDAIDGQPARIDEPTRLKLSELLKRIP